jgi:hypothetical protein
MEAPPKVTALELAYIIAKAHRLYIVTVAEASRSAYVVYRKNPTPGAPGIRLGRRSDPGALLHFIRKLTANKREETDGANR